MKKVSFFLILFFYYLSTTAQVTGIKNIPGDYASLNAAITALNASGVGAGGATINIAAGYNETAPAGGYELGSAVLNASTSAANPLLIQGHMNVITAPVGTTTNLDGIFSISGTDYVTLIGLDLRESAANTDATKAMEWGIGLFNRNASAPFDGCQHNTITACKITLNRTIATPSKGIYMVHNIVGSTTALSPTAAGDMNSYNVFTDIIFANMITAIYLGGTNSANDEGNEIGNAAGIGGNLISNVIGSLYSSIGAITCIYQNNCIISGNSINNTSNGGINSIATSWGIYAYGPNCTYTVNYNNITLVESALSNAYAIYGIYGNAAGANITAKNNYVSVAETGGSGVNNIAIYLPNGNNTTIANNIVTQAMAVSGTTYGIYTTSTGTMLFDNNTITQTSSVATSSQFYSIVSGGTATSETITNNKFTNTNVSVTGTTGYLSLIYATNGTGNKNIKNNSIVGSLTHNSSADLYGIVVNPASAGAGTAIIDNNNFSGISKSGTGNLYCILYAPTVASAQNYEFTNNTFSNIALSGTGSLYGIYYSSGATANIGKNNIHDLSAAGNMFGIYSTSPATGTQANIYSNQLYNFLNTGVNGNVSGICIVEGKSTTIYNNFIRNLQAPSASKTTDAIQGISLQNNNANTNVDVYYNTIYLNATSSGTNFSSAGIYHTANATAATGALDLRNNIIVNTSTANGSGTTAAFRRSGVALNNYKASSNNNLFYAGVPSAGKVIYHDGTNADQTLAAWQARAGAADAASISVMPNFVSGTDLHLKPAANCAIDGKAMPIASIADDVDGDVRDATTPDIGADEFTNPFKLVITNPAAVCAPATVDLTAAAVTTGSSAGTKTYWMDAAASTPIPAANGISTAITVGGTYYIKLDNGVGCVEVKPITVSIAAPANATISYATSPYCQNAGTAATVTQTGTTGGTYSSTTGLVIDASTGEINLAASTPGIYTVTYSIAAAGSCAAFSTTASVTITAMPSATISYTALPYCQSAGTATVTQSGTTGGTYSSTTGLFINATTGDINLAASTPGVYTVTYAFAAAGGCPAFSTTASVTVTETPAATISYAGSPYCFNTGTVTVTHTGTTGGTYSSTTGLSINAATGEINVGASTPGTYTVTYAIAAAGGCGAFNTTASVTITAPPTAGIHYLASPYCNNAGTATVTQTGTTGGTYSSTRGLSINTVTGEVNLGASTPGTYAVTYSIAAAGGCAAFSTTASITVTAMPAATIAYTGSPYCQNAGTASVTQTGTTGGTYSSTTGLSINASTGEINLSASTPGTYMVTYAIAAAGGCGAFNTTASVTITAPPTATIGYSNSPYCHNGGTATVTQIGTTGGTYSSATGLAIDASTGDINLAASTPGTYTVTYTIAAAGGCAAVSTTTNVVINNLSVTATSAAASITTSCGPASVNLNVAGGSLGTGASWKWYSGSCGGALVGTGSSLTTNVTATTTYYVRAEGVCNNTACIPVTVTINPQPVVTLSAVPVTSLLPGRQTMLTANVSPALPGNDFTWNKNNITMGNGPANAYTVTAGKLGTYTARVTTPAGCTALSNAVTIKDSLSYNLFIYPSPNNGLFTVSFYRPVSMFYQYTTLLIYDSKGALAYSRKWLVNSAYSNIHVDMTRNSKGIYMVMLVNNKGVKLAEGKVAIQ